MRNNKMSVSVPGIVPPKPLELTGNVSEKWQEWKERFEIYIIAIGYENKSPKVKTGVMLNIIGD